MTQEITKKGCLLVGIYCLFGMSFRTSAAELKPQEILHKWLHTERSLRSCSFEELDRIRKEKIVTVYKTETDGVVDTVKTFYEGDKVQSTAVTCREGSWTVYPNFVLKNEFQAVEDRVPQGTDVLVDKFPDEIAVRALPDAFVGDVLCYTIRIDLSDRLVKKLAAQLNRAYKDAFLRRGDVYNYLAVRRTLHIGKEDLLLRRYELCDRLGTPIWDVSRSKYKTNEDIPDSLFGLPADRPLKVVHSQSEAENELKQRRTSKAFADVRKSIEEYRQKMEKSGITNSSQAPQTEPKVERQAR